MSDIVCPHCSDAYIDCNDDELHCWKCGFSLTKEELKGKEALNMRKGLTEEQVTEIKKLSDEGMKQKDIAGKVGISSSSVCKYLKSGNGGQASPIPPALKLSLTKVSPTVKSNHKHVGLSGIEDEIIRRKVIIDKLTDEVNILEKAIELMGEP